MLFFGNPTGSKQVHEAMSAGLIGYIDTPLQGNIRPPGVRWCADNGCFNDKRFNIDRWWKWLQDNAHAADACAFATAPDVLGDAHATLQRSRPWLARIRGLGYPAAFVAQNGFDNLDVPWDDFDVLFIGGDDEFKVGTEGRRAILAAKHRGMAVHVGRVNGGRRYRYMAALGVDSCDGTYLRFGPDTNLPNVLDWCLNSHQNPGLFTVGDL